MSSYLQIMKHQIMKVFITNNKTIINDETIVELNEIFHYLSFFHYLGCLWLFPQIMNHRINPTLFVNISFVVVPVVTVMLSLHNASQQINISLYVNVSLFEVPLLTYPIYPPLTYLACPPSTYPPSTHPIYPCSTYPPLTYPSPHRYFTVLHVFRGPR